MMLTLALSLLAGLAQAGPCEQLRTLTLPHATITVAEVVAARQADALPAHCRVAATLKPSLDSNIQIEVWMPAENWNGKFQAVGNGGWAGNLPMAAMAEALKGGYATASTDTGHRGGDGSFALRHPEQVTDFAYRAVHEMTVASKAIVAAFYSRPARLSYFNGCSTGGRQGMMSAQRYPADYDAIVAGAPVYNMIHLSASQLARQVEALKDPARRLPPAKVTLLASMVATACDARDGVNDGIVNDPDRCAFDPRVLACKAGDGSDCLTASQVQSVTRAYSTVTTKSGAPVYPGSAVGFESGLRMPDAPMELHFAPFRYIGRQDAAWDPMTFDLEADLALTLKNGGSAIEAADPNLAAFKARGGKLLFYHGWADPGPAPANTLAYVKAVERTLGGSQDSWMRVFMMPGVGHCRGGRGPDRADFIGALDRWRDGGGAPDRIDAARLENAQVQMTRPLCPYPQVAQYKGSGSTNDAANFVCKAP